MKLILDIDVRAFVSCDDCSFEEFVLNWNHQVPHWDYLTDLGVNWIKGTYGKRYK